ncbi:hypothetical protein [Paucibacter sp. TC2R-5]|uniref:hypothetical protein n=1 Tax=Paucibacter sp. TC2R-5 TaxID=2893555 RepID=UPI0039DF49CA
MFVIEQASCGSSPRPPVMVGEPSSANLIASASVRFNPRPPVKVGETEVVGRIARHYAVSIHANQ